LLADGDLDGARRHADHLQKKTLRAAEQDRPDVAEKRAHWRAWQLGLDPRRLVFIDETWANTKMTRLYGRAPRGERVVGAVPHGHWKTTTLIAALDYTGVRCSMALDGAVNRLAFEAFVEQVLTPTLRPGDLVVMDNLSSHKGARTPELIRDARAELVYLPPYSPDLNPIEPAFSKIKQALRSLSLRTVDAMWSTMQSVLDRVTGSDAQGFFRHCGYATEIN
jgi:transposase